MWAAPVFSCLAEKRRLAHGTGCTLSSAIACFLVKGFSLPIAVRQAKAYLSAALAEGFDITLS